MKTGDISFFLASLTPEGQKSAIEHFKGRSYAEISAMLQAEISGLGSIRLDRIKDATDTRTTFVLFSNETDDGETRVRGEAVLKFEKIGGESKSEGIF